MKNITDKSPLVSVIMPAYNAERFIEEAIASVQAQSYENWELFVIDDGSKDRTKEIVKNLAENDKRIRFLINEKNMGVAKTRNRGIDLSSGKYVAFIDSDDVWHKDKLKKQLEKLKEKDAGIGYCSYEIIGENGEKAKEDYIVSETATFKDILKENYIQCSAMLIRSDIVKRFMFNTEFYHEDYILGLDMLRAGEKAAGNKELLLKWRYLENSRSFNKRKSAMNRWRIYRNYLKLPFFKSVSLFLNYAAAGLKKYR
ncbi:MAG: glycosyltransferase [Clostridia bacterium]|nr:glycosyltransferase [Clostridia bacterium]